MAISGRFFQGSPLLSSTATSFARNTTTYDPLGTAVAANTPRFGPTQTVAGLPGADESIASGLQSTCLLLGAGKHSSGDPIVCIYDPGAGGRVIKTYRLTAGSWTGPTNSASVYPGSGGDANNASDGAVSATDADNAIVVDGDVNNLLATGGTGGTGTFTRASGNFSTDLYQVGKKIRGWGWTNAANNNVFTITNVTATVLTVQETVVTESAGGPGTTKSLGVLLFSPSSGGKAAFFGYVPGVVSDTIVCTVKVRTKTAAATYKIRGVGLLYSTDAGATWNVVCHDCDDPRNLGDTTDSQADRLSQLCFNGYQVPYQTADATLMKCWLGFSDYTYIADPSYGGRLQILSFARTDPTQPMLPVSSGGVNQVFRYTLEASQASNGVTTVNAASATTLAIVGSASRNSLTITRVLGSFITDGYSRGKTFVISGCGTAALNRPFSVYGVSANGKVLTCREAQNTSDGASVTTVMTASAGPWRSHVHGVHIMEYSGSSIQAVFAIGDGHVSSMGRLICTNTGDANYANAANWTCQLGYHGMPNPDVYNIYNNSGFGEPGTGGVSNATDYNIRGLQWVCNIPGLTRTSFMAGGDGVAETLLNVDCSAASPNPPVLTTLIDDTRNTASSVNNFYGCCDRPEKTNRVVYCSADKSPYISTNPDTKGLDGGWFSRSGGAAGTWGWISNYDAVAGQSYSGFPALMDGYLYQVKNSTTVVRRTLPVTISGRPLQIGPGTGASLGQYVKGFSTNANGTLSISGNVISRSDGGSFITDGFSNVLGPSGTSTREWISISGSAFEANNTKWALDNAGSFTATTMTLLATPTTEVAGNANLTVSYGVAQPGGATSGGDNGPFVVKCPPVAGTYKARSTSEQAYIETFPVQPPMFRAANLFRIGRRIVSGVSSTTITTLKPENISDHQLDYQDEVTNATNNLSSVSGVAGSGKFHRAAGSFVSEGWFIGQKIYTTGFSVDNGTFTITNVTATDLTVAEAVNASDAPAATRTISAFPDMNPGILKARFWVKNDAYSDATHMTYSGPVYNLSALANGGAPNGTFTRADGGSFITDGFKQNASPNLILIQKITTSGWTQAGNNGTFTVNAVTASTLTVNEAVTDEAATGASSTHAITYGSKGMTNLDVDFVATTGGGTAPTGVGVGFGYGETDWKPVTMLFRANWFKSNNAQHNAAYQLHVNSAGNPTSAGYFLGVEQAQIIAPGSAITDFGYPLNYDNPLVPGYTAYPDEVLTTSTSHLGAWSFVYIGRTPLDSWTQWSLHDPAKPYKPIISFVNGSGKYVEVSCSPKVYKFIGTSTDVLSKCTYDHTTKTITFTGAFSPGLDGLPVSITAGTGMATAIAGSPLTISSSTANTLVFASDINGGADGTVGDIVGLVGDGSTTGKLSRFEMRVSDSGVNTVNTPLTTPLDVNRDVFIVVTYDGATSIKLTTLSAGVQRTVTMTIADAAFPTYVFNQLKYGNNDGTVISAFQPVAVQTYGHALTATEISNIFSNPAGVGAGGVNGSRPNRSKRVSRANRA